MGSNQLIESFWRQREDEHLGWAVSGLALDKLILREYANGNCLVTRVAAAALNSSRVAPEFRTTTSVLFRDNTAPLNVMYCEATA